MMPNAFGPIHDEKREKQKITPKEHRRTGKTGGKPTKFKKPPKFSTSKSEC